MDKNIKKLVSVIIPAFNVDKYISKTLDSVINQTYSNLEIIVVNDGSSDKTEEIIQLYSKKDTRIIYIYQNNKGVSAARNRGIKEAKGEYICFFDSDDIMLPSKIEKQYQFLENNIEFDIIYSNLYHFIDNTKKVFILSILKSSDYLYKNLLQYGNFINPNTVFFRKKIYEKYGGFDESIRSSEDWEYWLRLSYNKVLFVLMPDFLTLYRIRKNSLSSDSVVICKTSLIVLEKQKELPQTSEDYLIINNNLNKWNLKLILAYICIGDKKNAYKIAILSKNITFYYLCVLFPWKIINYIDILLHRFIFKIRSRSIKSIDFKLL